MSSELLDYVRPGRKNLVAEQALAETEAAVLVPLPPEPAHSIEPPISMHRETQVFQGPLDFPKIDDWLKGCEDNLERGRDGHEYTSLSMVFALNGCTRIDDIARMSPADIKALAVERDLAVTVGLVNRVHHYATADVARVKVAGKLF